MELPILKKSQLKLPKQTAKKNNYESQKGTTSRHKIDYLL